MDVPIAENVLGTIGAICWSIQLIPQIVINYRRHHTIGLQPSMMLLWACAGIPLGVYNIASDFNIALQIQPQILTSLSLITWVQCYHYQHSWSVPRSILTILPLGVAMGAIEYGLVVALHHAQDRSLRWPLTLMAVMAATLLAAGVLRHCWDIWRWRTVRGVSFLFVGIDAAGDVFSLVSVLFGRKLDVLGIIIYGVEFVLWMCVCAAGVWYRGIKGRARSTASAEVISGTQENLDHQMVGLDGQEPESQMIVQQVIPSSTSVFRTPSSDVVARAMSIASRTSSHPSFSVH